MEKQQTNYKFHQFSFPAYHLEQLHLPIFSSTDFVHSLSSLLQIGNLKFGSTDLDHFDVSSSRENPEDPLFEWKKNFSIALDALSGKNGYQLLQQGIESTKTLKQLIVKQAIDLILKKMIKIGN